MEEPALIDEQREDSTKSTSWLPGFRETGHEHIDLAIAIEDIAAGRLMPGERLPPQQRSPRQWVLMFH